MTEKLNDDQIARATAAFEDSMSDGEFRFRDLVANAAGVLGVSTSLTYRLADRFLQKQRKAGRIEVVRGVVWRLVPPTLTKEEQ